MANAKRNLTIKFGAIGEKKLIKAINQLSLAQKRLDKSLEQTAQSQSLVNKRVSSNTKLVAANSTMLTKAQSVIAVYRNKLLLASFAVTLLTTVFIKFVKMAGIQETSVKKLADVFGGEAATALDKYSSELQKVVAVGDEVINSAMAIIGSFGATIEETKLLTKASLDVSAALGLDLNTAALLVAKTIGSTTDALTRYGIGTDGATEKTKKIANIIASVEEKWGVLAEKLALTTEGQLNAASAAFGDLGEELGRVFAPAVLASANALRSIAESLDARKIKIFMSTTVSLVAVMKIWNLTTLATFANKRRLILVTRALKIQYAALGKGITITTIAQKAMNTSVVFGTKAMKALNLVIKRNPIGLLAFAVAGIALAFANWRGWLDDTTEELTDQEKAVIESAEALKEYGESVENANATLQRKYDLLNAGSEIEKFAIENGIELKDVNEELFKSIQAITEEQERHNRIAKIINKANSQTLQGKIELIDADIALLVAEQAYVGNTEELEKALIGLEKVRSKYVDKLKE